MSVIEDCGGALWTNTNPKTDYSKCKRCGRRLKTDEARERGYGTVCWKKHLQDNQQSLF